MARGNPNIRNEGKATRFSSTNQPKNRGNKPRLYTIAKTVYKCSYDDFKEAAMYLLQAPMAELKKIIDTEDTPIWMRNIARGLMKDSATGDTRTTEELVSRLWGKPTAVVSADVKTEKQVEITFGDMTPEQIAVFVADTTTNNG